MTQQTHAESVEQVPAHPPTLPGPLQIAGWTGPLPAADRIHGLDVARGVALFGILMVNILYFGWPLAHTLDHKPPQSSSSIDQAAFHLIKIVFEANFFTIFSTLFGVGLAVQALRSEHAGRSYLPNGLRRLGFLMVIGLTHALLIWMGDILFTYAVSGLLTLPLLLFCRGRTLIFAGCIVMALAMLLMAGMGALTIFNPQAAEATSVAATTTGASFERWWEAFSRGGPTVPGTVQPEIEAYSQGPYRDLFLVRAASWVSFLIFSLISFGWMVIAMFLVGMGLVKSGFFESSRAPVQRRLAAWGIGLGLPLSITGACAYAFLKYPLGAVLGGLLMPAHGLLAVGVISLICASTQSGPLPAPIRWIAAAGRTALSVYLLESIICTTIFYFYGGGYFGQLGAATLILIVLAVYPVVVAFAVFWQSRFRFGPMEWLWRTVTYWAPQPFRRHPRPVGTD